MFSKKYEQCSDLESKSAIKEMMYMIERDPNFINYFLPKNPDEFCDSVRKVIAEINKTADRDTKLYYDTFKALMAIEKFLEEVRLINGGFDNFKYCMRNREIQYGILGISSYISYNSKNEVPSFYKQRDTDITISNGLNAFQKAKIDYSFRPSDQLYEKCDNVNSATKIAHDKIIELCRETFNTIAIAMKQIPNYGAPLLIDEAAAIIDKFLKREHQPRNRHFPM